jgi:hypothetical protein
VIIKPLVYGDCRGLSLFNDNHPPSKRQPSTFRAAKLPLDCLPVRSLSPGGNRVQDPLVRDTTVYTLQLHFLKAHFDILLSSTLWSAKCSLVYMCSERKRCRPTPLPSFPYVLHAAPIADSLIDHPNSRNHCDNITCVCCSLCQSVPTAENKKFHWAQHGFRLEDGNRFSVRNVVMYGIVGSNAKSTVF